MKELLKLIQLASSIPSGQFPYLGFLIAIALYAIGKATFDQAIIVSLLAVSVSGFRSTEHK
jgi:hypothetical protein